MHKKDNKIIKDIIKSIKLGSNFFIACHQNPDGDTIGSALSIASVLRRLGKKVYIYSSDPVPDNLKFMPFIKTIKHNIPADIKKFDTAIMLECSTSSRIGMGNLFKSFGTIINIDHHKTAEPYGDINYINTKVSSTAELIYGIFSAMGISLTPQEAECLYVGVVTDTGRFYYSTTTSKTLRTAACLLDFGANAFKTSNMIYSNKALATLKLLGRALEHLQISKNGKIAFSYLDKSDIFFAKAKPEHAEGIVNYGLMVSDVKVAVLFREGRNRIAVTFRSRGNVDVSAVAKKFGGGGHKNAAGFKSKLSLKAIEKSVLKELSSIF